MSGLSATHAALMRSIEERVVSTAHAAKRDANDNNENQAVHLVRPQIMRRLPSMPVMIGRR